MGRETKYFFILHLFCKCKIRKGGLAFILLQHQGAHFVFLQYQVGLAFVFCSARAVSPFGFMRHRRDGFLGFLQYHSPPFFEIKSIKILEGHFLLRSLKVK
jgi:hypothetical protein